jgi:hypothetical protein
VTRAPNRLHSIGTNSMDSMLGQFKELAREYLPAAPEGRHHAFSNVSDTISELHQGVTNPTPAGRGWGWWEWVLRVTSLPAIDSSTPIRTNSDMFRPAWIKRSSPIFWRVDISAQSMTAIPVGRAHCAPAVSPRGFCPVRRHRASEPSLLRLDSGVDRNLPASLGRHRSPES